MMGGSSSDTSEAERQSRRARQRKLRDRTDVVAVALRNAAKHAENGVPFETIARRFFDATGIHLKAIPDPKA